MSQLTHRSEFLSSAGLDRFGYRDSESKYPPQVLAKSINILAHSGQMIKLCFRSQIHLDIYKYMAQVFYGNFILCLPTRPTTKTMSPCMANWPTSLLQTFLTALDGNFLPQGWPQTLLQLIGCSYQ